MAYKILRSGPELQQLVHRILEAPLVNRKLALIGVLNNTLQGKISFEALVDRWPDYSTLVLRPVDGTTSSKYFQRYRLVDANDAERMRDFLNIPGILPWDTTFEIRGMANKNSKFRNRFLNYLFNDTKPLYIALRSTLEDAMKEVIVENGSLISRRHLFYVGHVDKTPMEDIKLPQGYYFKRLRPEHAQTVYNNWDFAVVEGREGFEYVRYQIETLSSMAAYTEKHEPVSWVVNMFDGSSGLLGTVPEHRRKGLANLVLQAVRQNTDNNFAYQQAILASMALTKRLTTTMLTEPVLFLKCAPSSVYVRK